MCLSSDVDECSDEFLNTCDIETKALCTNTNGSFLCECLEGFTGDGYSCTGL